MCDRSPGPARLSTRCCSSALGSARDAEQEKLLPCTCEISTATLALRGLSRTERLRGGELSLTDLFRSQIILPLQSLLERGMRKPSTAVNLLEAERERALGTCVQTGPLKTQQRGRARQQQHRLEARRVTEGFYEITIKEQKTASSEEFLHRMVFVCSCPAAALPAQSIYGCRVLIQEN